MSVIDEFGKSFEMFSIWKSRRTVVTFARHMGCRFCKEQVSQLQVIEPQLTKLAIFSVVITVGRYEDIPRFRSETKFTGEIYVDSSLFSLQCYALMKLPTGDNTLFTEELGEKVFHKSTVEAGKRVSAQAFNDGGYGNDDSIYTGDILQIGGVFILGPGNVCDYSSRSKYVGDFDDMAEVLKAAGSHESTSDDFIYPLTHAWNDKLNVATKFSSPILSSTSSRTTSLSNWLIKIIIVIVAIVFLALFNLQIFPTSSYLILSTTLVIFTSALVLTKGLPNLSLPSLTSKPEEHAMQEQSEVDDKSKEQVKCPFLTLSTVSDVDKLVFERIKQNSSFLKCDCSFMQEIDMVSVGKRNRAMSEHIASDVPTGLPNSIPIEDDDEESNAIEALLVPLQSMQCYIREFLAKPNPHLGRKGPTCPFVPTSLKFDSLYLTVVKNTQASNSTQIEQIVLQAKSQFQTLHPLTGQRAAYKAIILIFPDVTLNDAPLLIDGVQLKLKPLFVECGLMLGEFHLRNNNPGLHNNSFFPLRTVYPSLAIRNMVPSDIVFLNSKEYSQNVRRSMIERYLLKFGDTGSGSGSGGGKGTEGASASGDNKETALARSLIEELEKEGTSK